MFKTVLSLGILVRVIVTGSLDANKLALFEHLSSPIGSWYSDSPTFVDAFAFFELLINRLQVYIMNLVFRADVNPSIILSYSAILLDLVYIGAIFWFTFNQPAIALDQMIFLVCHPVLILLDYSTYRYQSISIGLIVAALVAILKHRSFISGIFLSIAVLFNCESIWVCPSFVALAIGLSFSLKSLLLLPSLVFGFLITSILASFPFVTSVDSLQNVLYNVYIAKYLGVYVDSRFYFALTWQLPLIIALFCSISLLHLLISPKQITIIQNMSLVSLGIFLLEFNSIAIPSILVALLASKYPKFTGIFQAFAILTLYHQIPSNFKLIYFGLLIGSQTVFFDSYSSKSSPVQKLIILCLLLVVVIGHFVDAERCSMICPVWFCLSFFYLLTSQMIHADEKKIKTE